MPQPINASTPGSVRSTSASAPTVAGSAPVPPATTHKRSDTFGVAKAKAPATPVMAPAEAPPPEYIGGSKEAEDAHLAHVSEALGGLQKDLAAMSSTGQPMRTFHAMGEAVRADYVPVEDAQLPPQVKAALFDTGLQVQSGFARFSHGRGDENTNGLMPDVRGLWLRVQTNHGVQDLTGTNAEVPFFHDPEELIAFGQATKDFVKESGEGPLKLPGALVKYEPHLAADLMKLKPQDYPQDTAIHAAESKLKAHARAGEMLLALAKPGLPVHSFAETQFWSGAPLYLTGKDGKQYAFKYTFKPVVDRQKLPSSNLFDEIKQHKVVHYELRVQMYTDPKNTPIEQVAKWNAPEVKVGDVFLHTGEIGTPGQQELNAKVDKQGSNPLNRMEGIEPAGLNRLRVPLYADDTKRRGGCPFMSGGMALPADGPSEAN